MEKNESCSELNLAVDPVRRTARLREDDEHAQEDELEEDVVAGQEPEIGSVMPCSNVQLVQKPGAGPPLGDGPAG